MSFMKRSLPLIVRQAQLMARTDSSLKELLYGYLKKISSFRKEEEKLKWVHTQVDFLISQNSDKSSCLKGCHYCCYHPIQLSHVEINNIKKKYLIANPKRLEVQKTNIGKGLRSDNPISYKDRACVYLNDTGTCSVYQDRPLICRLTHVQSNPEHCHWENKDKPIEHLPVTKAALLVAAFYMGHTEIDYIPRFL